MGPGRKENRSGGPNIRANVNNEGRAAVRSELLAAVLQDLMEDGGLDRSKETI